MANMNRVILAGNLTRDPDARRTSSGTSVCKLGLAVNRRFRSQSGEQREETVFVDIDVWGRQADFCRDYLKRGAPVLVEGRLRMDSWEDRSTGQQRSKLVIVAENVQSLGSREGGNRQGEQDDYGQQQSPSNSQPQQSQQGGWNAPQQQQPAAQQPAAQQPAPPPFPSESQDSSTPSDDAFDVSDESIDDIPF